MKKKLYYKCIMLYYIILYYIIKLYCFICSKYRKLEKPKISCILEKTLVLSIISSKYKNEHEKIFKEDKSIEILKTLSLIENI